MVDLEGYYKENFEKFVKRVYRICGNYHDAEDVVQDAFERAVKYAHTCHDVDKWFSTILRNTYRDFVRRNMNWPITKPLDEHIGEIEPVVLDYLRSVMAKTIEEMVEKEKEPNRTIITLHISYGFSQGEISCLVSGTSMSNINNVLNRFKQKAIKRLT